MQRSNTFNSSYNEITTSATSCPPRKDKKTVFTHARHCETQRVVAIPSSKTKPAFTLAEVLITLGIIGIVAAMTLPTLIANHQKKVTATRLSQTYSQLSQALNSAQVEYGDMKNWDVMQNVAIDSGNPNQERDMTIRFVDTYMAPHLKLASKSRYARLKDLGYNGYMHKDGAIYVSDIKKYYISELSNGVTLFWVYNGSSINNIISVPIVLVDINGRAKPNMLGRDLFMFSFYSDKPMLLQPMGYGYSRTALIDACKKGAPEKDNLTCAGLIMLDGWEIKKDHPW